MVQIQIVIYLMVFNGIEQSIGSGMLLRMQSAKCCQKEKINHEKSSKSSSCWNK